MFQVQPRAANWRAFLKGCALALLCALPCLSQGQATQFNPADVDSDDDGLIEIYSPIELHNMRYNLAGTSYKTGTASVGNSAGCNDDAVEEEARVCFGYELMQDLDFDTDKDGTWSGSVDVDEGFRLDEDDSHADYFPVENGLGGWLPIGDEGNPFAAVFDGNSRTISNLSIRRYNIRYLGLFGVIGSDAVIRNLGLLDSLASFDYRSSVGDADINLWHIGCLVGLNRGGSIRASWATGTNANYTTRIGYVGGLVGRQADGLIVGSHAAVAVVASRGNDYVGGLVGSLVDGMITASYATGAADSGGNSQNHVGGLVGRQESGAITYSYATGVVTGGYGSRGDFLGGLVGSQGGGLIEGSYALGGANGVGGVGSGGNKIGGLVGQQRGSITASYAATGTVTSRGSDNNIGGLVGQQHGSITASYALADASIIGRHRHGGLDATNRVGGLVGLQFGSIMASYATGAAAVVDGNLNYVGGLVGQQHGSITASYATGAAVGGDGDRDYVGGLVGQQYSSITASYATGAAAGGDGDRDHIGGLVGVQSGGSITASYATGAADGGDGEDNFVGGLVGAVRSGMITESYGFGEASRARTEGTDGLPIRGVSTAAQLTAANAGTSWNDAGSNTFGAWDFGTDWQVPALNYADYDKDADVFDCGQFPANACGTLLPGQTDEVAASASGPSVVETSETVMLTGSLGFGRVTIESWRWQQLAGPEVTLSDANAREPSFAAPMGKELMLFELTATASDGRQYRDRISLSVDVDSDDDGLIEIYSPIELHNMRYNLTGTSYKTTDTTGVVGNSAGCDEDGNGVCFGYELMEHLDFDGDKDGRTWEVADDGSYSLDEGDNDDYYFPVAAGGWLPIGDGTNPFAAVFDGNGHSIRNLAIRRDQTHVGLFGAIGGNAAIGNLGLIGNLADHIGSSGGAYIGGLAGRQSSGSITASYATGPAAGGDGGDDSVGGLVGRQYSGTITAGYATGAAAGGDGGNDSVGGLVGRQSGGSITASYATGAAAGGDGGNDSVGGLVGSHSGGSITASYATGGAAASGDGINAEIVGGLVGQQSSGPITDSYGFGIALDGAAGGEDGSPESRGIGAASQLTAVNAGPSWNDAGSNTLGAWDFGTERQTPALNYADYDGAGGVFVCGDFPATACRALLPGQRHAVRCFGCGARSG